MDCTELIKREGWDCTACGHRHAGRTLANICIGCPCVETTPPIYESRERPASSPLPASESSASLLDLIDEAHMYATDLASNGIEPEKLAVIGRALRQSRSALRQVWNARGAADAHVVNASLLTGNVPKVVDAIKALDR